MKILMKILLLFLVLMGSTLFGEGLNPQGCDEKNDNPTSLKGNFLKNGKLLGHSCENKAQAFSQDETSQSPSDEKKLSDFKNFVNPAK